MQKVKVGAKLSALSSVLLNHVARGVLTFAFFLLASTFLYASSFPAQERATASNEAVVNGSLAELRDKRRVLLIVRRSGVVDASGVSQSVLSEIYKTNSASQTIFPRTYNAIARKLNKYMKDCKSISAAEGISDADFIVLFSVLEIRRPLGTPYAYGEMFVILNESSKPRIIWRTRQGGNFVEDAAKDLIRDLKEVRCER